MIKKFLYFLGGKEYLLRAQFKLPSVTGEEAERRRPIKVRFEIPYFTTSGIQVFFYFMFEKFKIFFRYVI